MSRSPLNVRPVTKQQHSFSARHSPRVGAEKLFPERNPTTQQQLKPLVPVPLTCSPGQRRSVKTTPAVVITATAVNRQQPAARVIVLPDGGRSHPGTAGKPVSPLISPTRRSLSPKEVVKGAYVRMQDPTECLETSLDEIKSVVKRSDSYRQANANSPRLQQTKSSPNMLMALQKARSENAQGNHHQHHHHHHFTDKTDIW